MQLLKKNKEALYVLILNNIYDILSREENQDAEQYIDYIAVYVLSGGGG